MCSSFARLRYKRVDQSIIFYKMWCLLQGALGLARLSLPWYPNAGGGMRARGASPWPRGKPASTIELATPAPSLYTSPLSTPFGNPRPGVYSEVFGIGTSKLDNSITKIGW